MKNIQISTSDLVGNKFSGYDLHLYLKERGIDSKQIVEYKISDDTTVYEYDFNHRDSIKNLIKKRTIFEADIINLQLVHNFFDVNYLPFFTKLKPTILTFHDPFFLGGHCVHHFDCDKWQSKCCNCPHLDVAFEIDCDYSNLNFEILKDSIQRSQISILVTSNWMMEKVKKSPIWKEKDIYYLPFGINTDIFKPNNDFSLREKFGIPKENIVLMFRADSGLFKGLDIIKKALESLKDMKNITLVAVANTGQLEEFRDYFQIIEYGWINDDELLANLYQVSDIFLMPSRQETFGVMSIEAMACGKTVLAINGEGTALPDVIDSPRCGIAVSEDGYTEQLMELIKNPELLKKHGDKSLALVRKKYTKEKYVDGIIDIYNKVIKCHKLDADAKFMLEQLDRYMPDSDADFDYGNVPKYNDCRNRLNVLENEFNLKCQELVSKNEELAAKNSELAEIRNKFQLKENEITNIYNSRSWKLIRMVQHKMKFWR